MIIAVKKSRASEEEGRRCPEHALKKKQQPIAPHPARCYGCRMARRNDLKALRNLIAEAQDLLTTTTLPEGRSQRAHELLTAAAHLADDLLAQSPAAALGAKGGKETAKRGSDYFRKIAAKRKAFGGGRPQNPTN